MVLAIHRRFIEKRQVPPDITALPTSIAGITGAATIQTPTSTASSLMLDNSAPSDQISPPPLVLTSNHPASPTSEPLADGEATPPIGAQSNSAKPISMTVVVGTCLGALFGVTIVVLIAYLLYRRYSKALETRIPKTRRDLPRNAPPPRSRHKSWNKLQDNDDRWEARKEMDDVGPMERLDLFKKGTPSVKTAFTHSEEAIPPDSYPPSFAQYHPFAQNAQPNSRLPVPQPFLAHVDAVSPLSWHSESFSSPSIHSSSHNTAIPPTVSMAIPTPQVTSHNPPRWESAEVVSFAEAQSAEVVNPFEEAPERRKSHDNPFFSAQDFATTHRRSRSSGSFRSRSLEKGKGRQIDSNPFDDVHDLPPPPPKHKHKPPLPTLATTTSHDNNNKTLQSLIAALDISEQEAPDPSRIASVHPSIVSTASNYTDIDDDVTEKFPLPPSGGIYRHLNLSSGRF